MRKILLTTTILAGFAATPALAGGSHESASQGTYQAPATNYDREGVDSHNWYMSVSGVGNFLDDADFGGGELSTDTGYGALLAFGKDITFAPLVGLRGEIELGWRQNDIDGATGGVAADGDVNAYSAMANLYYDFENDSGFVPYLGAGIGAANVRGDFTVGGVPTDDDDTVFAYQGIAGVEHKFNEDWSVQLEYRYFSTQDAEFETAGVGSDFSYDAHNVVLGLRYNLY